MNKRNWRIISALLAVLIVAINELFVYIIRLKGGFYFCNHQLAMGVSLIHPWWEIMVILIIILILYHLNKQKKITWNTLGLIMVLSGALSNLIDRYFFGCVLDFLSLPFNLKINLADLEIFFGLILAFINYKEIK